MTDIGGAIDSGDGGDASGGDGDGTGAIPGGLTPGDGIAGGPAPTPIPTPTAGGGGSDPIDDCPPGELCQSNNPDPTDCGTIRFESEVETIQKPGNVLLVFDRSGSMDERWSGMNRWQVAGSAISSALEPLADNLTIGSVFFPSPDEDPNSGAPAPCVDPTGIACLFVPGLTLGSGTCSVNPITEVDQLTFAPGPTFLSSLTGANPPIFAPVGGGRTPLLGGLQEAQNALAGSSLDGVTSVIVITDGEPNCGWDMGQAQQIVTDWQAQGINTYVIGLPGSGGGAARTLNSLAQAGGTNQYISADAPAALEQQLRSIAQETVRSGFNSCEIALNPATEVPEELRMIAIVGSDEFDVPRDLSATASWSISAGGDLVTLEGDLCTEAMDGAYDELRFEFSCKEIPPLPVPVVL